jgi:ribosomal protein L35
MKTHKTVSKRVKLTRTGKLIKRKAGQDHFNSRESGNVTRSKRRDMTVNASYVRSIKSMI